VPGAGEQHTSIIWNLDTVHEPICIPKFDAYSVGIGYHSNAEAAQEVAEQCQQLGAQTTVICADMANPEDVKYLFATLDSELGVLDVLINNAGVLEQSMRLDTMSAERISRTVRVGLLLMSHRELRFLALPMNLWITQLQRALWTHLPLGSPTSWVPKAFE